MLLPVSEFLAVRRRVSEIDRNLFSLCGNRFRA